MSFFTFWFAFAAMLMAMQSVHTSRKNRQYFKKLGEVEDERDELKYVLAEVLDGNGDVVGQLRLPAPPEQKALPAPKTVFPKSAAPTRAVPGCNAPSISFSNPIPESLRARTLRRVRERDLRRRVRKRARQRAKSAPSVAPSALAQGLTGHGVLAHYANELPAAHRQASIRSRPLSLPPRRPRSLPLVDDKPISLAGIPLPGSMANCAGCQNRSAAKYRLGSTAQYRCEATGGGVRRAILRQWQTQDDACSGWTPLDEQDDD